MCVPGIVPITFGFVFRNLPMYFLFKKNTVLCVVRPIFEIDN